MQPDRPNWPHDATDLAYAVYCADGYLQRNGCDFGPSLLNALLFSSEKAALAEAEPKDEVVPVWLLSYIDNDPSRDVSPMVFRCQDESLALLRVLYENTEGISFRELSERTELREGDLRRWLEDGAPDEMDVEALVRVADALGFEVCFKTKGAEA